MTGSRWWARPAAALLVGAVLLVGLLAGVFDRDKTLTGGPLAPSVDDGIMGSGIRLDPGEWFSDRTAVLMNRLARPAVLLSIRHVGAVGKLRDGRIYVALGTSSSGAVTGAGEGFPPRYYSRADLHDPRGFRVPPSRTPAGRRGAVVMTTGRLGVDETFGTRGYEVTYRVGRTEYRTELDQGVAVCAARKERCDPAPLLRRLVDEASVARGR